MKRIFVIRAGALGDVVLATPALRALRTRFPQAELHLVTEAPIAPIVDGLPYLTRVWRWEPRSRHAGPGGLLRLAQEIGAGGRFDLGVDLQNKLRTRALLSLLRPRHSAVLVKRKGAVAAVEALIGTERPLEAPHATILYLDPLSDLGVVGDGGPPDVFVGEPARAAAARLVGEVQPLVALAPGARWAVKRWTASGFAEVGNALAAAGAHLVLAGGPGDVRELEAVRAGLRAPPVGDTAGLDVAGLAAVLARCDLLVTGDSAPLHIAQAVGTPVVAVFGPTSWRRWGPLPGNGAALSLPLPCSPCTNHGTEACPLGHHDCMRLVPAAEVAEVALAALRAGRGAGGSAAASRAGAAGRALAVAGQRA